MQGEHPQPPNPPDASADVAEFESRLATRLKWLRRLRRGWIGVCVLTMAAGVALFIRSYRHPERITWGEHALYETPKDELRVVYQIYSSRGQLRFYRYRGKPRAGGGFQYERLPEHWPVQSNWQGDGEMFKRFGFQAVASYTNIEGEVRSIKFLVVPWWFVVVVGGLGLVVVRFWHPRNTSARGQIVTHPIGN